MSILAVLKKVNVAVSYLDDMRRWIDKRMMPLINGSDTAISDTTKNMLSEDSTFKEYLMHFVKEADFNISDIKIKKMAALFGHKVETERGEEDYVLPENSQSAGTTRMVELESIIYSQLKCQGLLCVDELEASIHPNLMEYMLTRPLPKRECHQVSPLLFEQFAHRLVVVEALVEGQGDICHVAECAVSNLTVEVPSLIAAEPKILLALFCQHLYAPTYLVGLEAFGDIHRHVGGEEAGGASPSSHGTSCDSSSSCPSQPVCGSLCGTF
jgi:hypothetical protein